MKPKIRQSKCISCEMCINECPNDCISISKKSGKAFIKQSCCTGCEICIDICPVGAIVRRKK